MLASLLCHYVTCHDISEHFPVYFQSSGLWSQWREQSTLDTCERQPQCDFIQSCHNNSHGGENTRRCSELNEARYGTLADIGAAGTRKQRNAVMQSTDTELILNIVTSLKLNLHKLFSCFPLDIWDSWGLLWLGWWAMRDQQWEADCAAWAWLSSESMKEQSELLACLLRQSHSQHSKHSQVSTRPALDCLYNSRLLFGGSDQIICKRFILNTWYSWYWELESYLTLWVI